MLIRHLEGSILGSVTLHCRGLIFSHSARFFFSGRKRTQNDESIDPSVWTGQRRVISFEGGSMVLASLRLCGLDFFSVRDTEMRIELSVLKVNGKLHGL